METVNSAGEIPWQDAEPAPIAQALERVLTRAENKERVSEPLGPPQYLAGHPRYEQEHDEREANRKQRQRESVWKSLVESRGPRYAKCRLENYVATTPEQQAALTACKEYGADAKTRIAAGENVLFLGPCGTGKDHLMMGLAYHAVKDFHTCLWIAGASLWLTYRDAIGIGHVNRHRFRLREFEYDEFDAHLGASEAQITDKLADVDLLCISDPMPPGGMLTDYQADRLYEIIDRRYSHLRPTFATLNVSSRQEAEKLLGVQVVDRLAHDATVVKCYWSSYRQKPTEGEAQP